MRKLLNLFGKQEQKPIIIVSGLPRSGTSMMMKMLEAGGLTVLTDGVRSSDTDNPEGYYEFERVKQLDKGDNSWLNNAEGKVVKIISALLKHLPNHHQYRVIFMHRNVQEILASQRKMLINRGETWVEGDDAQLARLMENHLKAIKAWLLNQPNIEILPIYYSDVLSDTASQVEKVTAFLQADLNHLEMMRVVDPDLYRNRA